MTIEAILQILAIVFGAGMFYAKLESISKEVRRLEKKQDHYNNLQERTVSLETWRTMHEKEHELERAAK